MDFYLDAILAGKILGSGIGDPPGAMQEALGSDYLDDLYKGIKRRDYGLIEFAYQNDNGWVCRGVSIQVHRLAGGGADLVPEPVLASYGAFGRYVELDGVVEGLHGRGVGEDMIQRVAGRGFDELRIASCRATAFAVNDLNCERGTKPGIGDVWTISIS
ncbi:hypothetical protein [Catenulispora pinisilvae]|uniref:hypothetical protein n=1 Tax=Catenulispora pinisilvae TaxID=2705253 RepID=UPI001890CA2B|nr:hypothetical protein [Catenulispora pinisilvae]